MGLNINPQAAITPGGLNQSLAGLAGVLAGLPAKRREQAIEQQHLELQRQGLAQQLAQHQAEAEHWKAVLDEQHQYHASAEAERQARAQLEQARTGALWIKGLAGALGFGGKQMTPKDEAEIAHLNAETAALKGGKAGSDLAPPELVNSINHDWESQQAEDQARATSVKGGQYMPAPGRAQSFKDARLTAAGYDPRTLRKITPQSAAPAGSDNATTNPTQAPSPKAVTNPTPSASPSAGGQVDPSAGMGTPKAQVAPVANSSAAAANTPGAPPAGGPSPWRAKLTPKFGGTLPPALDAAVRHAEAGNPEAIQLLQSKYGGP